MSRIELGDLTIDVVQKDIKNIHLSVYPPIGKVRIAAPTRLDLENIRVFAISKLGWIRKQQAKITSQEREPKREYKTRESHYYLGKRYLLNVIENKNKQSVIVKHEKLVLNVKQNATINQKKNILHEWYRERLKEIIPKLIDKWERRINVNVSEFKIRKMKTKWGTCNTVAKRICINLELARKPIICIEYIVVHEIVHLLERKHNERFIAYMNKFMPNWRTYKDELNKLPISHTEWKY